MRQKTMSDRDPPLFEYRGKLYPSYLKRGNAMQFIEPVARQFCKGKGLDVGAGRWRLPGAMPIDMINCDDACDLNDEQYDFIFSSHCLEHLANPVEALLHLRTRLRVGGTLFLYLPHPDMEYWRPQNCRKHLHLFWPGDTARMVRDLGFDGVIHSERDLAWSFSVIGFNNGQGDT